MAVFTSGEFAIARAKRSAASSLAAPADFDGDQLARTLAVANNLLGQVFQHTRESFFKLR